MLKNIIFLVFITVSYNIPCLAMESNTFDSLLNKANYQFCVLSQHVNYLIENGGPFSFEKQIEKVIAFKNQGKKVGLILGRTAKEGLTKFDGRNFEENEQQAWAFLDLQPMYGDAPHFAMDITDISAWKQFPNKLFSHVIFDWTAFDYALGEAINKGVQSDVFDQLTRILEPSGILSFNVTGQGDSMLARKENRVCDSANANIYPHLKETDLATEIRFLASWNQSLREENRESDQWLIEGNSKELARLVKYFQERGEQSEEETVDLVTHVTNRLLDLGYQEVVFEESRPWGNYKCGGFFIAIKTS